MKDEATNIRNQMMSVKVALFALGIFALLIGVILGANALIILFLGIIEATVLIVGGLILSAIEKTVKLIGK